MCYVFLCILVHCLLPTRMSSMKVVTCAHMECLIIRSASQQTVSLKGQMLNTLGLVDHMVPAATAQLCYCSMRTDREYQRI